MLANTTAQKVSYADVVCCFCCYSQECRSFLLPVVGGPPVRLDAFTLLPWYFWKTPGPLENQTEPCFSSGHTYACSFSQLGQENESLLVFVIRSVWLCIGGGNPQLQRLITLTTHSWKSTRVCVGKYSEDGEGDSGHCINTAGYPRSESWGPYLPGVSLRKRSSEFPLRHGFSFPRAGKAAKPPLTLRHVCGSVNGGSP